MAAKSSSQRNAPVAACALAAAIVLLVATLVPGRAAMADADPWTKAGTQAFIVEPFRLNLGFADQTGTPRVALVTSLPPEALEGMPDGLLKAKASPLFQSYGSNAGYFAALWSAIRNSVCNDVHQNIQRLVDHSPNTAYDIQPCVMNPAGYLLATFQTQWEDNQFRWVTGRRLILNYSVPLNGITFWVTSEHTCHHNSSNCGVRPPDPAFTVVFTTNISAICAPSPYATITTFALPVACTPATSIDVEAVIGGDATGQLQAATKAWGKRVAKEAASIILTAGAAAPVALAAFAADTIKELGIAIADIPNAHLRDEVSAWIVGFVGSGALNANRANVGANLNRLFQDLYAAQLAGLRPFLIGVGPRYGLDFGLIYPLPAKPQVKNVVAAANAGSIISPTIAVSQPEVQAGHTIPVTATNFHGTYVNALDIGWNKTVIGKAKTTLSWGPPPVTDQTPALTFTATNLKPGTAYGFRVHECDGLTCAPWSDLLTTATESAGSNQIALWLDADKAQPVGSVTANASGAPFVASIKVPSATAPGPHVLHAAMPGQPLASAPITVCRPGGCLPSLAVVNTSNNTLYPPGEVVEVSQLVTLRGSRFAPGGAVSIFLDTTKGPKAGSAPVGPLGNCQATFIMPSVAPGPHKFLAPETKPGPFEAGVAVYVQAMPQ